MKVIKKIIAISLIASIFFFSQSKHSEANPAVMVAGVAAAGALILAAAGVNYYKPITATDGFAATATSIGRLAVATFNVLSNYGTSEAYSKIVSLKMNTTAAINALSSSASGTYTNLKALFLNSVRSVPPPSTYAPISGNEMTNYWINLNNNTSIKCGAYSYSSYAGPGYTSTSEASSIQHTGGTIFATYMWKNPADDNYYVRTDYYTAASDVEVGHKPAIKPSTQYLPLVAAAASNPTVQNEFDQLYLAYPLLGAVADTMTPNTDIDNSPPFVPPANVINPATTQPLTTALPLTQAAASTAAAAAVKADALTQAQQAVQAYQAANPASTVANDATLAALVAAQTAAATSSTAAASLAAQTAAEADVPLPAANPDALKAIDFSPFLTLNGVLASKFPFTLLNSIGAYFTVFNGPSTAPVFHIPIFSNTMTIDLSFMDTVATVSRYTIAFLMSIGTVFYIVRRYTD